MEQSGRERKDTPREDGKGSRIAKNKNRRDVAGSEIECARDV